MFEALKEKFQAMERCKEPSCAEGGVKSGVVYPPDRSEIGRAAWRYVHSRAHNLDATFKEETAGETVQKEAAWLEAFVYLYPCRNCARDFVDICARAPPNFKNYESWWIDAHNAVNKDLGKPTWKPKGV